MMTPILLKVNLRFAASLLLITLVPSLTFVSFQTGSLAAGLFAAAVLSALLYTRELLDQRYTLRGLSNKLLFVTLAMIGTGFSAVDEGNWKPIASLAGGAWLLFFAAIIGQSINRLDYKRHEDTILLALAVLLLLGLLQLIEYAPTTMWWNYDSLEKPVFPFSEQSHYALAVGMLAVAYATVGRARWIISIWAIITTMALLFPNLTLLLFSFLVLFSFSLRLPRSCLIVFFVTATAVSVIVVSNLLEYSEYFSNRLDFVEPTNLTTLVYLQGWHLAYLNLTESGGIGIGFQLLGSTSTVLSPLSETIASIGGKYFNVSDGGFLAAKLIAEFGVFGLLIVFGYTGYVIWFPVFANKTWKAIRISTKADEREVLRRKLLLGALVFGFLVEMYFRGYGYYSPGLFLAVVAINGLLRSNQVR